MCYAGVKKKKRRPGGCCDGSYLPTTNETQIRQTGWLFEHLDLTEFNAKHPLPAGADRDVADGRSVRFVQCSHTWMEIES